MSVLDTSRHLLDPRMRYATALMQQGRVLIDADWNEMVMLEAEDRRQTIAETVCTEGSPNDGFKIGTPAAKTIDVYPENAAKQPFNSYDFGLGSGSFYLGGYRFTIDQAAQPETFQSQADWLTLTLGTGKLPAMPTTARTDLVYLYAWQQAVTSVEDQEFRERALSGPDTTVRVRRMRRIEVLSNVTAANCAEARAVLRQYLGRPRAGDTGGPHSLGADGTELLSKARLSASFITTGADKDPCKPSQVRGFIGAENQAIRVQLTAASRFVWGIDNASPLYRVQVDPGDPANKTIKFLTVPRDQAAMPLQGQAIELLPWGAVLANEEKAAAPCGFLSAVASTYDPDHQTLTLNSAVPQNMIDWLKDRPAALNGRFDPPGQQQFFYLRIWTGGTDQAFTPGTPTPLTDTGIDIDFADFGIPGDFWVIAARPNTPDQLVPWRLLDSAPPHGPRRFYSALALIDWSVSAGNVIPALHDCREHFRALCRNNDCCQIVVGDGITSFGDAASIQDAIDSLPPQGGEVCLLRGVYKESIKLSGRKDVVIHGCGKDTVIVPSSGAAAVWIAGSSQITLRDLAVEAPVMVGVQISDGSADIVLQSLAITARDHSAVIAKVDRGFVLEHCALTGQPLAGDLVRGGVVGVTPLLYAAGQLLRIESNRLVADTSQKFGRTVLGGLQIGGGSRDVEIRRNLIRGGNGNGITLGSLQYVPVDDIGKDEVIAKIDGSSGGPAITAAYYAFDANNCVQAPGDPQTQTGPDGVVQVPVSEGNLCDVRIVGNRIEAMGQSGIAPVLLFFSPKSSDLITIYRLSIIDNLIHDCMGLEVGIISPENISRIAFGGIILPDVEIARVDANFIEDVGVLHRYAICGIFVVMATGIALCGNRLRRIGPIANVAPLSAPPAVTGIGGLKLGLRGGLVIRFAMAPSEPVTIPLAAAELSGQRQDGVPAAVIHDNVVVAREGRALFLGALGPVSITDNQFTAHGSGFLALLRLLLGFLTGRNATAGFLTGTAAALAAGESTLDLLLDALGGNAVLVYDLGWSNEIYRQLAGLDQPSGAISVAPYTKYFIGGNILFDDNQVVFDSLGSVFTSSLCAVLLFTFDTITMGDDQVECDLALDFVVTNTLALALSTQVTGNRFTEGIRNAYLSAITIGLFMNGTGLNVGTHCIAETGLIRPGAVATATSGPVNVHLRLNLALSDPAGTDDTCLKFQSSLPGVVAAWPLKSVDAGYLVQRQ
jgi:hypothetical protein